jgi:hypothetical protein
VTYRDPQLDAEWIARGASIHQRSAIHAAPGQNTREFRARVYAALRDGWTPPAAPSDEEHERT